jgi:LysM repeat protein
VAYRVQLGDTLFSIAQRVGSSVAELRTVNCIADADTIFAEQVIYVPGTPGAPSVRAEGCSARGVIITVPEMGALVSGVVEVRGTANIDNFSFYRLEIRAATANAYTTVMTGRTPVNDGVLGEIDFADYGVGLFYVRLVVVNQRGTFPQPCAIPVLAR